MGQEPPPRPVEDYDGRSLFERLQEQKTLKQEQWDEKMKLSNQFRGIDEEDSAFLAQVQDDRIEQEKLKKKQELDEIAAGQAKLAEKVSPTASTSSTPLAPSAPATKSSKPAPAPVPAPTKSSLGKKDQKSILKGVVIKKKEKEKPKAKKQESSASTTNTEVKKPNASGEEGSSQKRKAEEKTDAPDEGHKKARLSTS
ncbi:hypothetical protein FRB90_004741 [Tulasnella sp. 427]|nr:hypothetical protein FRB90_004741 [Tulasnella sp. 427]